MEKLHSILQSAVPIYLIPKQLLLKLVASADIQDGTDPIVDNKAKFSISL